MRRTILQHPDPVLRAVSAPVLEVDDAVRVLIRDMFETMYDAKGRGLAAPQVGVLSRVFVTDTTWKGGAASPRAFVNAELLSTSPAQQENDEGCLSIADHPVRVSRPERIELIWLDETGAQQRGAFEGFDAACICHEMDHLDGRLILDYEAAQ
jgi:peptide deformylase